MVSKEESSVPKKNTTKRTASPKVGKKTLSVEKSVRKSIKTLTTSVAFVVPAPLPPPPPPAISLPVVSPPKAPVSWWVYLLIFFFAVGTLLIVGYVAIWRPFTTSVAPVVSFPDTSAPSEIPAVIEIPPAPDVPKTYSYLSVVDVPTQADFFASDDSECYQQGVSAPNVVKPESVSGKTRVDFVIPADIPSGATDELSFRTELSRISSLIDLLAKHKFKATLQLTSPFVNLADKLDVTEVAVWAKAGNEVAIAFDPIAAFGVSSPADLQAVPFGSWLLALHKQQVELEDLCRCTVTSWSDSGVYPRLYQAAKELGLTTHVDWSDGEAAPASLAIVNPWTPIQSGSIDQLETFDPFGSVVYVPNGVYPEQCPDAASVPAPFSMDHFTYSTKAFYASLVSASADRVNVFRLNVNPDDFGDSVDDEAELTAWNEWLTTVLDPYVKSGTIVPSTDSATSAAFVAWLDQNIGKIELK